MTDRELLQQALDALEEYCEHGVLLRPIERREALRARLAQPEQEQVAWISHNAGLYHGKPDESLNPLPLYTTPPQREWQGMTDDEIQQSYETTGHCQTLRPQDSFAVYALARAIEAKLKEKNNG